MIDLVITHFGHFDHFEAWSPRVAKGRQGSPMVAKGFQGPRGKIELWAPYTIWQAVLKGLVILR